METKPIHLTAEDRAAIAREQVAILQGDRSELRRRWRSFGFKDKAEAEKEAEKIGTEIARFLKWGTQ